MVTLGFGCLTAILRLGSPPPRKLKQGRACGDAHDVLAANRFAGSFVDAIVDKVRPALVQTHCFRRQRPMGLLPFRGFIREFAPLERSQRQQGVSSPSVRELRKPIAF